MCLPPKSMHRYSDDHPVPHGCGTTTSSIEGTLRAWLVHTSLQLALILTVPVVSYFQYDLSFYSMPLPGMRCRCVSGGEMQTVMENLDQWWVGRLHFLPLQ